MYEGKRILGRASVVGGRMLKCFRYSVKEWSGLVQGTAHKD